MTQIIIARICYCCILLLMLCRSASAAPPMEGHLRGNNNGRQRAPRDYYGETTSAFGYLASKAMGAFVRVASFMFQWMPSFWRPAKSNIPRFLKNNYNRPRYDDDYDFFDADAYR